MSNSNYDSGNQLTTQPFMDVNGNVNLDAMSPVDKKKYLKICNSIDEKDPNSILNYASTIQGTLANQSDSFLQNVRKSNSGEVGILINDLLSELNYVDVDDLSQNKFKSFISRLPLLNKMVVKVDNIFAKYDKITNNIDQISKKINLGIINSAKDNAVLQTIFESNVETIKNLEDYIISGNMRLERASQELKQMESNPLNYQDHEVADKRDFLNRLDRRLADLKVVRLILMQSLPQIRLVQNNNISISEKAQTLLTNTLPVWKNQLSLAVAMHRQQQNIEVQQKVTSTTEEILKKNAERLGQNTINVSKMNEKTIVSVETLKQTTQSLINTINEVKKIQEEGFNNRRMLDGELQNLEQTLKTTVKGK